MCSIPSCADGRNGRHFNCGGTNRLKSLQSNIHFSAVPARSVRISKTFLAGRPILMSFISAVIFPHLLPPQSHNWDLHESFCDVAARLIRSASVSSFLARLSEGLMTPLSFRRQRNRLPFTNNFPKRPVRIISSHPGASISGSNSCGLFFTPLRYANKSSAFTSSSSVPTMTQRQTSFSPGSSASSRLQTSMQE